MMRLSVHALCVEATGQDPVVAVAVTNGPEDVPPYLQPSTMRSSTLTKTRVPGGVHMTMVLPAFPRINGKPSLHFAPSNPRQGSTQVQHRRRAIVAISPA